jgi:hypothetical protein
VRAPRAPRARHHLWHRTVGLARQLLRGRRVDEPDLRGRTWFRSGLARPRMGAGLILGNSSNRHEWAAVYLKLLDRGEADRAIYSVG